MGPWLIGRSRWHGRIHTRGSTHSAAVPPSPHTCVETSRAALVIASTPLSHSAAAASKRTPRDGKMELVDCETGPRSAAPPALPLPPPPPRPPIPDGLPGRDSPWRTASSRHQPGGC